MVRQVVKILLALSLVCLAACKYNPENLILGDEVQVIEGFYRGCSGTITDSFAWMTPCQHKFTIHNVTCPKANINYAFVSVCDIQKIK